MSAATRFHEIIESAKAELRSLFGRDHEAAEAAAAKLDEVKATVENDARPIEHEAGADAEALAHEAEQAGQKVIADAESDGGHLAEDAEHEIASSGQGAPEVATTPPPSAAADPSNPPTWDGSAPAAPEA